MTKILWAKPLVEKATLELQAKVIHLKKQNKIPFLQVILAGNDPASLIYTTNKKRFCEKIGAKCEILHLNENISPEEFIKVVQGSNQNKDVHGIIIQLPVPPQLRSLNLNGMVKKEKDVDGFHPENIFDLLKADFSGSTFLPCTPKGISDLLAYYQIPVAGKHVVIIGRSMIVGKPISLLMSAQNATVSLCHSQTQNLKELTRNADILIVAIGKAKFITKDYINPAKHTVIIDVGMNFDGSARCGDVDFENVSPIAEAITPVPGGVGPLTILSLAKNLIKACEGIS